ncbi:pentatricopeptide repeat-containing protein At5g03800 [Cucurbita maxima]|uniref:Pentatricopeptide repeat-containing protein At5g03800 n=1 Tax=Cucurbita maxima TaxID=3661 RepID=A0A6J1IJC1_CUCMA|nr:pentatricopeptide repeat-containing protein At5g03800 [Cucurbita maxima]
MAAIVPHSANAISAASLLPSAIPFRFPSMPINSSPSTPPPPLLSKTSLSLCNPKPCHLPLNSTSPTHFLACAVSISEPLFASRSVYNSTSPITSGFDLLRLSTRYGDADLARAVHACFLKLEEDVYLGNALIATYLRLGLVQDADKVFSGLSCPNVVSYSAMISGFSKSNREDEAVELFFAMLDSGIEPNEYTFVAILTACIRNMDYQLGSQIHDIIIKLGYLNCVFICNALLGFYSKCGFLELVLRLFDEMPERDITSWNTVISSLVSEFRYDEAFGYFRGMQRSEGLRVDNFSLSTLLTASTGSVKPMKGQQLHALGLKVGLESHLSVSNSLIGFYTKCGSVNDVMKLFEAMPIRDVITWTGMITSYMEFGKSDLAVEVFNNMPERNCVSYNAVLAGLSRNGNGSRALELFIEMLDEGMEISDCTLTSIINACGLLRNLKLSQQIQCFIIKFGILSNSCIETALVDMYTRLGRMADAEKMFHQRSLENDYTAMLTSMICGYARNKQLNEAISLFHSGQSEGAIVMDEVVSTSILSLCGSIGFHEMGKQMHCHALKSGIITDTGVGNATVSMYSKCWNMDDAVRVFDTMNMQDVVSWNGLISGHLLHRQGDKTLEIWKKMEKAGVKPDNITFVLIISAYKHTELDLVDRCRSLFFSMKTKYNIKPTSEHYASFISVLGRWGYLEEAEETIRRIPFEPGVNVWRALLDSCRINKNERLEKVAARCILAVEPKDPFTYILKSNLYSASGRWLYSEKVREDMREKGFRKHPSQSWIIHENRIHSFYARDKSHPQVKDIYSGLDILVLECLKAGYVPDTSFVLQEVEEHQKKEFLFYHSGKLAATFGILLTRPGQPVRIVKSVRLCGDCHTFLKYVSIITRRKIFVRDTSGFHCFADGQCSCKDYW